MLNFIRSNSQSFGVKLAFGLIILVFVFWGVGSMQSMSPTTLVASVNNEPISVIAFEQAYAQARESVRRNNPSITTEQLKQFRLPEQVLQQLIFASLLQQEAKRLDIVVSPLELRKAIEQIQDFHNAEGQFDPALYKRLIEARGQRLSEFESFVKTQLLEAKLRRDVTITGEAYEQEVDAFIGFTYEQRNVEYLFFPMEDALANLNLPAEDSIKAYYESNRQAFNIPAKADIDYIVVSPTTIIAPESIKTDAISKYYNDNKDSFTTQPRAKVRHILLTIAPDASNEDIEKASTAMQNIEQELKAGADFNELAKKYSQDTTTAENGGDLNWINPGDTVAPFNDAVFSMQSGEVSAPIRTDFGLHLIKVDEVEPARTKELSEVEDDIKTALAQEMGMEKLREVLDNLIEANILGKNLAEAAKAQGLELNNSGLLSSFELEKLLQIKPESSAQIFATAAGVPLDAAIAGENNTYIVAKVKDKLDSSTKPFEEVKDEIVKLLQEQNAMEKAIATASDLRKTLEKETPADVATQAKLIVDVQRDGAVGELGTNQDLNEALFDAEVNSWLPAVYSTNIDGKRGAIIARVVEIKDFQEAQVDAVKQLIGTALGTQRKEKMFQLYMSNLRQNAEIEILNEAYLDIL